MQRLLYRKKYNIILYHDNDETVVTEYTECYEFYLIYFFRYWTNKGISWARNTRVNDIDDTAMAFRLLRLHGYSVSEG